MCKTCTLGAGVQSQGCRPTSLTTVPGCVQGRECGADPPQSVGTGWKHSEAPGLRCVYSSVNFALGVGFKCQFCQFVDPGDVTEPSLETTGEWYLTSQLQAAVSREHAVYLILSPILFHLVGHRAALCPETNKVRAHSY